jgi:hypothetical protein
MYMKQPHHNLASPTILIVLFIDVFKILFDISFPNVRFLVNAIQGEHYGADHHQGIHCATPNEKIYSLPQGSHFFYERTGAQFFMRAVHYQDFRDDFNATSSIIDSLEDGAKCDRDIPYLQALGINTVYIVFVRPDAIHSTCMAKLRAAGIYVIVNLGGSTSDVLQNNRWDRPLQQRYTAIVNSLAGFSNVLGFWIMSDSNALPFVKAAIRDVKEYLQISKHRSIPIGYAILHQDNFILSEFLSCGEQNSQIDFLFYYLSKACPGTSQMQEDLQRLVSIQSPLPIFLVTKPCATIAMADSKLLLSAYSENYTSVHSGLILFNYFDSALSNRSGKSWIVICYGFKIYRGFLGLVEVKAASVTPRPGFSALASQMAYIQPLSTKMAEYSPTRTANPSCSSIFSFNALYYEDRSDTSTTVMQLATVLPPTPDATLCNCMMETLDCAQNSDTIVETESLNATENLLNRVCPQNKSWCLGASANATEGSYGAFSVCNSTERASWVLNRLYSGRGRDSEACTSSGGLLRMPSKSQSKKCQSLLRQAGQDGTGTVIHAQLPVETSENPNHSANGALSTLAKAGIGVGFALLILLAAIIFLLRQRWRRSLIKQPEEFEKAELPDNSAPPQEKEMFEINGDERVEIEGNKVVEGAYGEIAEMPTVYNDPVELEVIETRMLRPGPSDLKKK